MQQVPNSCSIRDKVDKKALQNSVILINSLKKLEGVESSTRNVRQTHTHRNAPLCSAPTFESESLRDAHCLSQRELKIDTHRRPQAKRLGTFAHSCGTSVNVCALNRNVCDGLRTETI